MLEINTFDEKNIIKKLMFKIKLNKLLYLSIKIKTFITLSF